MPARRKSVENSIKREAIEWIATEGGGVPSRAARHFRTRGWRISPSCYRQWWNHREEILASSSSRRRLEGAGRRPVLGEAEDKLVDLIYDARLRKEKVTRDWIAFMARRLFFESRTEEEHEENPIRFTASDPWLCEDKSIKMAVIPGGLTPYLQAGDVGIYKSFKDKMSVFIDDWKRSDAVE
ncbi:TPA: hypothetical protein N0F65_006342 [Lagenidium giganteum]|uniref:Transposase n=1 Tax=Lagenidium giganteum TaxID=4803 RepID=A0AAV2YDL1_9STRA|nr:TPA: hypothetical protein N0F65_006342 [Lagenidium giganteum]